ncbi:MAG TPA: hypothetical protein VMU43_05915 [Candidatus Acidoferrum sp.]|nr:hypothetical protein [Candidatus Acidoferrum sp.]
MRYLRLLVLAGAFLAITPFAHAQSVAIGVGVGGPVYPGPAPVCAYGYYPYAPYACAPVGYYGPNWFVGGVFIGAGPWYHGYYGHPAYWGRPGFYPRPVPYGRPGYVGIGHSPVYYNHGAVGGSFHGGPAFRGGASFHGGGGFHGGGHR